MSIRTVCAALGVAAFAILGTATAFAHSVTVGSLTLTDLWSRATPPGAATAAGYLTIANSGSEADRLVAVASPAAGIVELHVMEVVNGVMSMHPVAGGIEIPAGATATLAPGGLHIMFVSLTDGLVEGGEVPVTLMFEKAGTVDTFLHILAVGAQGPAADADMQMPMPMPAGQ